MNNKVVYLYGAGGHAKVVIDILKSNNITVQEIYDNNFEITELMNIPVVHNSSVKSPLIISIGNNTIRKKIVSQLFDISYERGIDKSAIVSESAYIGEGSLIMQGVTIQSSVAIGKHSIINTGASIDHDCIIHDYVHIAPGVNLCGNIEIGEGTLIGAGSVIIPGIKIGSWSIIGAGSVITNNIPDNVTAVGSPCKIIKYLANE